MPGAMELEIHAGCVTSANPTQVLRAPAARGARNKGCYFWTHLYPTQHEQSRLVFHAEFDFLLGFEFP
jgi:hypothetical protein